MPREATKNNWITMHIPPEIKKRFKVKAVQEGRTMQDIVNEKIVEYLNEPHERHDHG